MTSDAERIKIAEDLYYRAEALRDEGLVQQNVLRELYVVDHMGWIIDRELDELQEAIGAHRRAAFDKWKMTPTNVSLSGAFEAGWKAALRL